MSPPGSVEELVAFDPHWCLFWGKPATVAQSSIWLPYVRRSRYRYVVLSSVDDVPAPVREQIADLPDCVVLEPFATAVDWLRQAPHLRGFLYPSGRPANFRMVNSFPGKAHIWIGHGESEKLANAFRTASLYDSIFIAQGRAVRRFPRAIRGWVGDGACVIGTPVAESVSKDPWSRPRPIRTILYAPTWEGYRDRVDYSSLREVGPVVADLLPRLAERGTRVILRPHPATGHRRPSDTALVDSLVAAGAVRGGEKAADFAAADVMISDISGVTGEFLFTEKPAIMPVFDRLAGIGKDETRIADEYPWVYRWNPEGEDLLALLERIETSDPLRRRRAVSARRMFRGHRSLDDAVDTFDLALSSVRWRKSRIPVRWVFEAKVIRAGIARLVGAVRRLVAGR
jgi:hypothetical protein